MLGLPDRANSGTSDLPLEGAVDADVELQAARMTAARNEKPWRAAIAGTCLPPRRFIVE